MQDFTLHKNCHQVLWKKYWCLVLSATYCLPEMLTSWSILVLVSFQLIEDLRKELEHLQLYKLECERPGRGRSSSSSLSEFNAKTREVEMEHEIKRLKQVKNNWEMIEGWKEGG